MTDLLDAYGRPFDPRPTIERWRAGDHEVAPQVLWQHLYHQGNVGSASFAAVPDLVNLISAWSQPDWNAYAMVASVEEARTIGAATVPATHAVEYARAWSLVQPMALKHLKDAVGDELIRSLLAVIAHAKGQHTLAAIALCTEDERREMLD